MFGLSVPELILVGIIALIVFGPDKLPEIASKIGRLAGELKRHSDALRREFYNSVYRPIEEAELNARREQRNLLADTTSIDSKPTGVNESGTLATDAAAAAKATDNPDHQPGDPGPASTTCVPNPDSAKPVAIDSQRAPPLNTSPPPSSGGTQSELRHGENQGAVGVEKPQDKQHHQLTTKE